AGGGRALDAQTAVQSLHAVGQPAQAGAASRVGAADPVVDDLDACDAVPATDAHLDGGRLRVLRDVGQRLGDDVVRGRLDGGRQPVVEVVVDVDGERGAPGESLEGRPEAAVREDRR